MRTLTTVLLVACVAVLAFADALSGWDIDDARMAQKLELQVDKLGNVTELEYHIDPAQVPQVVRDAMDALHPGGDYAGAEKERQAGVLYYELTRVVDGREVEAMFTPAGVLHAEEVEVDASAVPEPVKAAIQTAYPEGTVDKWEEIRNDEREVVEYHVKLTEAGRKVKVTVSKEGVIQGAVFEIPAEIEVPAPPR